jgi:hypothetical protein
MPARWSADSVLALAPDDSSRRAAGPVARSAPWRDAGATGDLVWGLCAGSGKIPYQVIVDLPAPAFNCSCPSRKFPCKHALGLLLRWSAGTVPDAAEPPGFARAWRDSRWEKQQQTKPGSAGTQAAGSAPSAASNGGPGAPAAPLRDEAAAARRSAERTKRVTAGLADLQEWLRDQVRVGLASAAAVPPPGRGGRVAGPAELMAARMVDAQAPAVAGTLRALSGLARTGLASTAGRDNGAAAPGAPGPARAADWPARLLAEYGLLHLLARAHERLDMLPEGLAAVVRSRVGYPVARRAVLARPAVPGRWLVTAVRDLTDATVPGRRVWLRETSTSQWAMLLTFAAPDGAWQDPDAARLRPGTEVQANLHYYPVQPALRAVLGDRPDPGPAVLAPGPGRPAAPAGGIDGLLADWAAALEQDPWLTTWPALLTGTPVPPGDGGPRAGDGGTAGWLLVDQAGNGLPVANRESLWTLLSVSGGHPVTVAGEWHPDGLVALTTWHGPEAVPL